MSAYRTTNSEIRPLARRENDVAWSKAKCLALGVLHPRGTMAVVIGPSTNDPDERVVKHGVSYFAAVVDEYLDAIGIVYEGAGAWLLKESRAEAGLEPDECYILHDPKKTKPDLAIEVVWTSGGIDKLEIYKRLGVGEVWFWIKEKVHIYVLGDDGFEEHAKSACLPGFDFALLLEMLELSTLSEVRKAIRARFTSSSS
jgi:hypothetical protein